MVALGELITLGILYIGGMHISVGIGLGIAYIAGIITACVASGKASKKKLLAALVLCLGLSAVTACNYIVRAALWHGITPTPSQTYAVTGTVDALDAQDGVAKSVTLRSVRVGEEKVRGNVRVTFEEDDVPAGELSIGTRLRIEGKLYGVPLIGESGKIDGNAYRTDVRYRLYGSYADARISPGKAPLYVRIRGAMYRTLREACGETYGAVAYCMLTGDKSELRDSTVQTYSIAGIGHILAVSGLHVGLLAAIAGFLLRKCRAPRLLRTVLLAVLLFGYAAFAGFAASALRAAVTGAVGLFAGLGGRRRDPLSTWSFAFAVLLAASPFMLYEAGFLMSFSAVLGIVFFAPALQKLLQRVRLPRRFSSVFAVTVAVQAGTFPVSAYFYGGVQTYSLLCNVLLVPLLSVTFGYFLLTTPVCLLLGVKVPLSIGGMGLALTDTVAGLASALPGGSVYVCAHGGLFALYPLFFVASRFVMLPGKRWVALSVAAVSVVIVLAPTLATLGIDKSLRGSAIVPNGRGDVTTVFTEARTVTVVGDVKDAAWLRRALDAYGLRAVDTVVVHALTEKTGAALRELVRAVPVGRILCPADTMHREGIAALNGYGRLYAWEERGDLLPQMEEVRTEKGAHAGYTYEHAGVKVLCVGYAVRYTAISPRVLNETPIVRCHLYLNAYADRIYLTNMPRGYLGETPARQFSAADLGAFAFSIPSGKVLG